MSSKGHNGSSGLQNHSIGPLYPWTIQVVGDACQALNCLTGETKAKFQFERVRNDNDYRLSFYDAHEQAECSVNESDNKSCRTLFCCNL